MEFGRACNLVDSGQFSFMLKATTFKYLSSSNFLKNSMQFICFQSFHTKLRNCLVHLETMSKEQHYIFSWLWIRNNLQKQNVLHFVLWMRTTLINSYYGKAPFVNKAGKLTHCNKSRIRKKRLRDCGFKALKQSSFTAFTNIGNLGHIGTLDTFVFNFKFHFLVLEWHKFFWYVIIN